MPFRFFPESEIERVIRIWESEDFEVLNGYTPDVTICLKFPTYYLNHPRKIVWLLHQHRNVYEIGNPILPGVVEFHGEQSISKLRDTICSLDTLHLNQCRDIFTISRNVSRRLLECNQIPSKPLYHPPPLRNSLYSADAEPYIFFPSRLEILKRQSLLIQAMKHVKTSVVALIAGTGGQASQLQNLIIELGLEDRVRLLNHLTEDELTGYYAYCLGVFFGPYDEDYGYVTLEAMLAKKPVITCSDSGGPLEFVRNGDTGYVVEPEPKAVAEAIDNLASDKKRAREMGMNGYNRYHQMGITWENVIDSLLHEAL